MPQDVNQSSGEKIDFWPTTLDSSGQIAIPVEVRSDFGWDAGTKLVVTVNDNGVLEIRSAGQFIKTVQDYFATKFGPDCSIVDELITERREEARREESSS